MSSNAARPARSMQHFDGRPERLSVELTPNSSLRSNDFWPGVWSREAGSGFAALGDGAVVEGPDVGSLWQHVKKLKLRGLSGELQMS